GAVDEPELRALLARSISRGNIRGVTDVDDTLTTLRDALGLLVERAPGVYGLVHETLAELLAAHVAVRTRSLEALIRDPVRGFSATWYEVIRFALGILGTLQGDDLRLDAAVRLLVAEAHAARGEPSAIVPELLGSIGVDDPSLTPELAEAIAGELVPAWWFDGTPAFDGEHAGIALADRILTGPWARELAMAFIGRYRPGWGDRGPSGLRARLGPMGLLRKLGCPLPLLLCEALVAEMARGGPDAGEPDRFTPLLMITPDGDAAISYLRFAMRVSGLSALLREGCGRLFYAAMPAPAAGAADADVAADADGAAAAIDASWELLDDGAGTRMIGRRLDAPPPESLTITGPLHILVVERPDPAYLPRVLAAWRELAGRYPDGPRPPASLEEATDRYAALDEN
ncbi:MAG TPA: hypothetical protein VHE35_13570, partial [Kofleriaceae bacterium]|nr:hypothetical protein [Kofleriaceae bacterium]